MQKLAEISLVWYNTEQIAVRMDIASRASLQNAHGSWYRVRNVFYLGVFCAACSINRNIFRMHEKTSPPCFIIVSGFLRWTRSGGYFRRRRTQPSTLIRSSFHTVCLSVCLSVFQSVDSTRAKWGQKNSYAWSWRDGSRLTSARRGTAARPWQSRSQGLRWLYEAHRMAQTDGQTPGTAAEREASNKLSRVSRDLPAHHASTTSAHVQQSGTRAIAPVIEVTGHLLCFAPALDTRPNYFEWPDPGSCYCCQVGCTSTDLWPTFSAHRVQERAMRECCTAFATMIYS